MRPEHASRDRRVIAEVKRVAMCGDTQVKRVCGQQSYTGNIPVCGRRFEAATHWMHVVFLKRMS